MSATARAAQEHDAAVAARVPKVIDLTPLIGARRRRMRRPRRWPLVLALALCAILAWGAILYTRFSTMR